MSPAGAVQSRLRRAHVDPARVAVAAEPGVPHADRDDTACAWEEAHTLGRRAPARVALENEEALLERVHVLVHGALGGERAHPDGHVHRARGPVDERAPGEAGAGARVRGLGKDLIGEQDVVHCSAATYNATP